VKVCVGFETVCYKASERLQLFKTLKRSAMSSEDLAQSFKSIIRPVLECACSARHSSLNDDQRTRAREAGEGSGGGTFVLPMLKIGAMPPTFSKRFEMIWSSMGAHGMGHLAHGPPKIFTLLLCQNKKRSG
jgi:hypothetical protein